MAKRKFNEPTTLDESNVLDVAKCIGDYRSQNISYDTLKEWAVEAANKLDIPDADAIYQLPDGWFIDTWGFVGRMYNNDLIIKPSNIELLYNGLKSFIEKSKKNKAEVKSKVSPMEIVKDQVETFYQSIESQLDDNFDIVSAVQTTSLTNTHLRKLISLINNEVVKSKLESHIDNTKVERKPRKKKIKTKEDICKDFKCMLEFEGVVGYSPEEILNANCVVVYHTQKKSITFYHGEKLSVSRSMIIDFDEQTSGEYKMKTDHKIEDVKGKVKINNIYTQFYKNEEKKIPTGRVSDKMIIIGKY